MTTARTSFRLAVALGVAMLCAAYSSSPEKARAPKRLADTGLYADFASKTIAPNAMHFVPQYPLWSDGASKERWIELPPHATIDASDPDRWVFPIGTKLWKEFSFGRRVETRYMERGRDGAWIYATYVWSADERQAELAPERGLRRACESSPGVAYDVPGVVDCKACHQGKPSEVLGFGALELSSDRDPLAPHAVAPTADSIDLAKLVLRGAIRNLPQALVARAPRIRAESPRERAVLGYLHANCSACHNSSGPLAEIGLDFEARLADGAEFESRAIASTLGLRARFVDAASNGCARIAAGDPEHSLVARRMSSRDAVTQMPPFGSHLADREALELVSSWIREDLSSRRSNLALTSIPSSVQSNHKE